MGTERPGVQDILAGDDWMKVGADHGMDIAEISKQLAPLGRVSAGTLQVAMTMGEWLGQKLGLKSSTREERTFAVSYAVLVRALILALSSNRYAITALFDTPKGAFVEAQLPKDFRSLGGTLRFDVIEDGPASVGLAAACEIRGQWFDWDKSKQMLEDVLEKTNLFVSHLQS